MMYYQSLSENTKKLLSLLVSVLLAFLLLFMPATCAASKTQTLEPEPVITYQITEPELTQLEAKLEMLDQLLAQQDPELTALQLQLIELKQELTTLRKMLTTSKEQLLKAERSLQNANLSLRTYAQEEKKKRLKIKAQRNGWAAASILLAGIAFVK